MAVVGQGGGGSWKHRQHLRCEQACVNCSYDCARSKGKPCFTNVHRHRLRHHEGDGGTQFGRQHGRHREARFHSDDNSAEPQGELGRWNSVHRRSDDQHGWLVGGGIEGAYHSVYVDIRSNDCSEFGIVERLLLCADWQRHGVLDHQP